MAALLTSRSVAKQVATPAVTQEEEEDSFNSVDKLQSQGINVADIQKLKAGGFCTVSFFKI